MPDKALLVSIRGHVQGVGFRMWTEREAEVFGLRGWVKNEPDGSVTEVPVRQLQPGDHMVLRPGAKVPVDGVVCVWEKPDGTHVGDVVNVRLKEG